MNTPKPLFALLSLLTLLGTSMCVAHVTPQPSSSRSVSKSTQRGGHPITGAATKSSGSTTVTTTYETDNPLLGSPKPYNDPALAGLGASKEVDPSLPMGAKPYAPTPTERLLATTSGSDGMQAAASGSTIITAHPKMPAGSIARDRDLYKSPW